MAYRENKDPKFRHVQHLFKDADGVEPLATAQELDLNGSPAAELVPDAPDAQEPPRHSENTPDISDEPDRSGSWDRKATENKNFSLLLNKMPWIPVWIALCPRMKRTRMITWELMSVTST